MSHWPARLRLAVAALVAVALVAVAAACSRGPQSDALEITAVFPTAGNLFVGSEVRVLGLQVGDVIAIEPVGDAIEVTMRVEGERDYPADVHAALEPVSLLGERFVQLTPPYTGGPTLADGARIERDRTAVPAEVDEVLRSFENFLESLDAQTLAELIDVLSETLEGQGEGLNTLVADGAETIRVLADSSVDLNGLVNELADFNETVATREDRIAPVLDNLSIVVRTLVDDREQITASLVELQRATAELEPLVFEHSDPLVRDLEILATTLGTVDRNLTRLGDAFSGANLLFTASGRARTWEEARIRLDNELGPVSQLLEDRLVDRLVGLCLRLEVEACADPAFFEPLLPDLCIPGVLCGDGQVAFATALGDAFAAMPPEVEQALIDEAQARDEPEAPAEAPPAAEPEPTEPPDDGLLPPLPLPDPRLAQLLGVGE